MHRCSRSRYVRATLVSPPWSRPWRSCHRFGGGGTRLDDRFLGFDDETHAREPDIACVGNRALAGAWIDDSTSPARVELLIREMEFCGDICTEPGFWNGYDLGPGRLGSGVSVAATNDDVYVAWMKGNELRLKRFELGAPGVIDPHPTITILEIDGVGGDPMLAATDERVVVVYSDQYDARVRISDHGGRSGPTRPTSMGRRSARRSPIRPASTRAAPTSGWRGRT